MKPSLLRAIQVNFDLARLPRPLSAAIALFSGSGARQGYLAIGDQALISLANFAATLLLARNASPTQLGVYGVGFTALRLARAVQEGIAIQPLNAFGAPLEEGEFKAYATATTLLQALLALASAACVALLGWGLTRLGNDTAGPAIFSLWPAFLFWQMQEYLRRMLYTRGRVFGAMLNTALANGFRLAWMVWLVGQGELTGVTSLNAIALGSLAALLPGVWQTRPYWSRCFTSLRRTWERNWEFGRWVIGGLLANWVALEFYPVLTAGMVSFAAAGAYRALQNIVAPVFLILRAADTFLTPRAARAYQETGRPALARLLRLTYLTTGLPILGLLALALLFPTAVLYLLYGDTYLAYSDGLVLMVIFYGLLYLYTPLQIILKAARQSRPIFVANLAAIVAMFSAGIWMIYQWGVYGTIAGQILNSLIVTLVLWISWNRLNQRG
jgi:O-antigen/teichoic acid export membrane protein